MLRMVVEELSNQTRTVVADARDGYVQLSIVTDKKDLNELSQVQVELTKEEALALVAGLAQLASVLRS